ncbi:MAG TPA: aminopeptidase [Lachnospiraceae bacterium]|nr:aminopeptidase [Lachnospiraceae bacterium]
MKKGERNLISDVPGVTVGHCTVSDGAVQTGVTAVLPHSGNLFRDKVMAACHVLNGFGKTTGLVEIEEMGFLETPVLLTNTLSVGTVSTALVEYMLEQNPEIGNTTGTVNPVVCECNDGYLSDIRGLHVTKEHAKEALGNCRADFEEGAVGAGRGMKCHGLKGGIGSASRRFQMDDTWYTIGALTLTNHGLLSDLEINGKQMGKLLEAGKEKPLSVNERDRGSVITLLATDVPLSERQLKRLCKRAAMGLARTGSYMMNGSGEIVIAFTTANRIPHVPATDVLSFGMLADDQMDVLFRGVAETVEEAVLSSMLHAETVTGRKGRCLQSLEKLLRQAGGNAALT